MDDNKLYGLCIFKKESQNSRVLRDLLQYIKSTGPGKKSSFAYIDAETSLHPNLSLWENLQIEIGPSQWIDFQSSLKPEWLSLVNLIQDPTKHSAKAKSWECFIISLLKGLITPAQNLLLDLNEEDLSPFLIGLLKRSVLNTTDKSVFIATANPSLWIDCAHTIVDRRDFKFDVTILNSTEIKKNWAA